ncbi:unnamed protein product [Peronospora farinosa]|uniref:Uncharacterized protein n=1 Tax=Peronospora farinosa TaxID=134698 RepID=A0ABN8CF14_9STRA|nr:unnamed protein product [Peronospora farinosa]
MQVGPSAEHGRARSQCIDNLGKQDCSAGLCMDSHGVKTPTTMQCAGTAVRVWDKTGSQRTRSRFESAELEHPRVGQRHAVV